MKTKLTIFMTTYLVAALSACASQPEPDPFKKVQDEHNAKMIASMQATVGKDIGSFMTSWGMTPQSVTPVAGGNLYIFYKQTGAGDFYLDCTFALRTNADGIIVQWSTHGTRGCPSAGGP